MGLQTSTQGYILSSPQTVFTLQNLTVGTLDTNRMNLVKRLNYYVKNGVIRNLRRGVYAKKIYNEQEVACVMYAPCYISLQYVLQRSGVIFQYDSTITSVSYLSREIIIDGKTYSYRKVKPAIMVERKGIICKDNISMATPERAFLDTIYLYPDFYFDRIDGLDKSKIMELLPIYKNKKMEKRVLTLLKDDE